MATTKDKMLLQDIEQNRKKVTILGTKEIKIRRLVNAVAKKFDRYTAEAEMSYKDGEVLLNMTKNRNLIPKSVSLIILGSWLRVSLFHWIHWRILDKKYDTVELSRVLKDGLDMGEYNGLLISLAYLQDNSSIIQKATRGIIRNMMGEQNSEGATQSSPNSMVQ
jgi:hypothetical protein